MIDDAHFNAKKQQLDADLKSAPRNVGIAFGSDLFEAFRARDQFTLEVFKHLGLFSPEMIVPAYQKSHFVFPSWGVALDDYQVGK